IDNLTFIYIFFFFQAEDGIRDRNVTGVQTCALPIFSQLPLLKSQTVQYSSWLPRTLSKAMSCASTTSLPPVLTTPPSLSFVEHERTSSPFTSTIQVSHVSIGPRDS